MRVDRATSLPIVVLGVGLMVMSSVSVVAQDRSRLMTPWGDPNLQGTWNNITGTPLERPAELSDKEFYTEEEAVAFAEQTLRRVDRDRRDGAIEADVGRAYNEFWSDRATKYLTQLNTRTSLIVDPKDGRLPSLTSGGETRIAARRVARERNHSWSDRNLWERCLTRGVPRLPGSYNNNFMIVQAPGYVVILVVLGPCPSGASLVLPNKFGTICVSTSAFTMPLVVQIFTNIGRSIFLGVSALTLP